MRDFLPQEKARRERVLAVIRETYRSHGFDEIETPVVEESERLHSGLGGDNEKLGYAILKRGLTVDDLKAAADPLELADLGLRFDLTVPLVRFYATHRAELPSVFRAIQIAPVWRAERPQKGRYRQFVQCDIDVIGEAGPLAEIELLTATLATLAALGLTGCSIRINDRRLLTGMLDVFGFAPEERDGVLITIDKLDKIDTVGVIAELRERGVTSGAVDALDAFFRQPQTMEFNAFGVRSITKALPHGVDATVIAELAALGEAVGALGLGELVFDPFLVRGMGYYTGTIFEIAHPDFGYALGGGGRYDGLIGRFLGTPVPAAGFSLGFERIVDLAELSTASEADAVALIYDEELAPSALVALKTALMESGVRVRLERRARNLKPLMDQLAASGFTHFAFVTAGTSSIDDLVLKPLD
jgi:histidyl-tRNA synthetase